MSIWREPSAETEDYPGLVVCDGRVTGSITIGKSRLPLWAFVSLAITEGWEEVEAGWSLTKRYDGYGSSDLAVFVHHLMEMRGEFGRLLCILADVERRENKRRDRRGSNEPPWFEHAPSRKRVIAQLRLCLAALEGGE